MSKSSYSFVSRETLEDLKGDISNYRGNLIAFAERTTCRISENITALLELRKKVAASNEFSSELHAELQSVYASIKEMSHYPGEHKLIDSTGKSMKFFRERLCPNMENKSQFKAFTEEEEHHLPVMELIADYACRKGYKNSKKMLQVNTGQVPTAKIIRNLQNALPPGSPFMLSGHSKVVSAASQQSSGQPPLQDIFSPESEQHFIEISHLTKAAEQNCWSDVLTWCSSNSDRKNYSDRPIVSIMQDLVLYQYSLNNDIDDGLKRGAELLKHERNDGSRKSLVRQGLIALALDPRFVRIELTTGERIQDYGWSRLRRKISQVFGIPSMPVLSTLIEVSLYILKELSEVDTTRLTPFDSSSSELPVYIDLPLHLVYHSIFVCPVLKTQISQNDTVVKLGCNHVISMTALDNINSATQRIRRDTLKCYYCGASVSVTEVVAVFYD